MFVRVYFIRINLGWSLEILSARWGFLNILCDEYT